eukprot:10444668-Lingulodinium_polyedra.AAC.1
MSQPPRGDRRTECGSRGTRDDATANVFLGALLSNSRKKAAQRTRSGTRHRRNGVDCAMPAPPASTAICWSTLGRGPR